MGDNEQREGKDPHWQVTLWAMVGIQFVMSVALTVIGPILPLFLPEIGVKDQAAIEFWAGLLNSTGFLVAALVSPLWGAVADRRGRKLMVMRSSLAICVFTALMAASGNVWQLFLLRSLMGAFSGFSASAIALVATRIPEGRMGMALGWLSTGQLTGSLAGPVVGGLLADATGSFRLAFCCTSVLAGLALLAAWWTVPEGAAVGGKRPRNAGLRTVLRSPGLLPLFVVLLLAQFGARSVTPVVTIFVQDLTGPRPDIATLAGLAFSVTGLADLVASPFLGKRSDHIGYRRVLLIGLGGAALATLPQAFARGYWEFTAERFALGLFIGGVLPTANALVGRLVPASSRGLAYGLTASATFLGAFLGPFTGGTVASLFGVRWVFVVTAAVLLANWVWVALSVPEFELEERAEV